MLPKQFQNNFDFKDVIEYIDSQYDFTPSEFSNEEIVKEAGQNNGSCKVFSFAKLQNLSKEQTLSLFAEHYQSVLQTPDGNDHHNIRNFLKFGWDGISFQNEALIRK
ncbi:HopJ type III effector protein [uncultured Chryseobacterium sp.]|uniref:HopJ type III effector protein n=1 Tax=uncultured Chryseobacterium sp. TaxID=259322 RepID=UPI0026204F15|nr:HopJ type III effector protein [uncultured Chryseobacterium sp.]